MEGTGVILYLTYHALPELLDCSQPASQPASQEVVTDSGCGSHVQTAGLFYSQARSLKGMQTQE